MCLSSQFKGTALYTALCITTNKTTKLLTEAIAYTQNSLCII